MFRSGDADAYEEPFRLAARIEAAGCYEPLIEPVVGTKGKYYAEWFDLQDDAGHDDVRAWYEERRAAHPEADLNLLIDRIGLLGPDPRGLAVWGIGSWGAAEPIARETVTAGSPIRPSSEHRDCEHCYGSHTPLGCSMARRDKAFGELAAALMIRHAARVARPSEPRDRTSDRRGTAGEWRVRLRPDLRASL